MRQPAPKLVYKFAFALLLPYLLTIGSFARAELTVNAADLGFVTPCAEMDNVLVALTNPATTAFPITVRHPAYTSGTKEISQEADFTDCVFPPNQPVWRFTQESHVLYEDAQFRLQGHRLTASWRPELVPVSVGDKTWPDLHLLQLVAKRPNSEVEVLVLYPSDGHWRAKPLPPAGLADSPYGASFMIGPMEVDRRPLVKFTSIRFDPAAHAFTVQFAKGGEGRLTLESASIDELRLSVRFSAPVTGGPFAVFSSMYVNDGKADTSWMVTRTAGQPLWQARRPVTFQPLQAAEFGFTRTLPSGHNTLAPDYLFGPFTGR